ncbi:MAG: C40 family peptidase [Bacteroidetes bacterium]|nr:C40 family peptidase [Bacteroidota bacterium]
MTKKPLLFTVMTLAVCILLGCETSEELMHPKSNIVSNKDQEQLLKNIEQLYQRNLPVDPERVKYLKEKFSNIMKVRPEDIKSVHLYSFIDEWYGVRYRMGGTTKDGVDCSGLAQNLYEKVFGIDLVRTSLDQFKESISVRADENMEEGDLIFFKTRGKHISHVGIYLMNSFFVHASNSGVMISSLNEDYWHKRFAGAGYIDINLKEQ